MPKNTLINLREFLRQKKTILFLVPDSKMDLVFDMLSTHFGNCFHVLEIHDITYMFQLYRFQIPVILISQTDDEKSIAYKVTNHYTDNNYEYDNIVGIRCAILANCIINKQGDFHSFIPTVDRYLPPDYQVNLKPFVHKKDYIQEVQLFGSKCVDMSSDTVVLMPGSGGYGDASYALPVLHEFYRQHSTHHVVTASASPRFHHVFSCCYPEHSHILFDAVDSFSTYFAHEFDAKTKYLKLYRWSYKNAISVQKKHYIEKYKSICDLNISTDTLLERFDQEFRPMSMSGAVLEVYHNARAKNHRKLISVQFTTDSHPERSWSVSHARCFLNLCEQNDIAVILLSNGNLIAENSLSESVYDLSSCSVSELFPLIGKMDLHAGIDSCFGHIAGVLGVPSVTIWGMNTPYEFYQSDGTAHQISFRVLRKNLSIFHQSRKSELVLPKQVFTEVVNILSGQKTLSSQHYTFEDSRNLVDTMVLT